MNAIAPTPTKSSLESALQGIPAARVECAVSDFSSVARGKVVGREDFIAQAGCRLPSVVLGLTLTGQESPEVFGRLLPKSYLDVQLVPDLSTLVPPSRHEIAASVLCEPGGPLWAPLYGRAIDAGEISPRAALRRVIARLGQAGFTARVAPELEFYLLRREGASADGMPSLASAIPAPGNPAREQACEAYSLERAAHFTRYFDELLRDCERAGIPVTGFAHESAYSQYEVNFLPGEALAQADAVFRFKRLARQAAARHGFLASFLAKPFLNQPGCGMHWHFSLQRADGTNPFAGSTPAETEGPALRHFIAGVQRDAGAAMAFFAPHDMSYERIRRSDASPSFANWGHDDRSVALRVPASSAANRRVENRLPGGDANPYLVVAATLGLGLLGIEEALEPAAASDRREGHRLPQSLPEALSLLGENRRLRALLGDPLVDLFCAVQRQESHERNAAADPRAAWDLVHLPEQA